MISGLLQGEELIKNGDFSKARNHWKIAAKDELAADNPLAGGPTLLKIYLNERKWSTLEQDLDLSKTPPSIIKIKIELQASADFMPEAKSKEYTDVDFGMGGSYVWSALVFPKADCLIIVENFGEIKNAPYELTKDQQKILKANSWEYRPIKLKPGESQVVLTECKKLMGEKSKITIAFPPGTGSVAIKSVSVDLTQGKL